MASAARGSSSIRAARRHRNRGGGHRAPTGRPSGCPPWTARGARLCRRTSAYRGHDRGQRGHGKEKLVGDRGNPARRVSRRSRGTGLVRPAFRVPRRRFPSGEPARSARDPRALAAVAHPLCPRSDAAGRDPPRLSGAATSRSFSAMRGAPSTAQSAHSWACSGGAMLLGRSGRGGRVIGRRQSRSTNAARRGRGSRRRGRPHRRRERRRGTTLAEGG